MTIKMPSCEIIFAEFGATKFSPDIDGIQRHFPEATITYLNEHRVRGPFYESDQRWGNRMNDYWKVRGILESKADVAICMDADTRIVSDKVRALFPLVRQFGLCLPANPRRLVMVDTAMGADSDQKLDESLGFGHAFNMTPIAVAHGCGYEKEREVLNEYLRIMETAPVRGPLAMWRACYNTGFFPCLLPAQWCVCAEDVGCGNEVILHVGHDKVREHYGF
jgi:hypothetical protein